MCKITFESSKLGTQKSGVIKLRSEREFESRVLTKISERKREIT
jgi:hypothetical protein